MNKIACTHPGKMGDCLYSLPTVKALCKKYDATCDFYTSEYCAPLKDLFEYQSYIDNFYVVDHKIEHYNMGIQPYYIPVQGTEYSDVFQLGFASPPDRSLPDFIALQAGVERESLVYEHPETSSMVPTEPFIVIATRGRTSFDSLFIDIIKRSPVAVVLIGGKDDSVSILKHVPQSKVYNLSGCSFLDTVTVLSQALAFVGLMSSQLVLANGFSIPKISPHDGRTWDMRHIVESSSNFYPINPSADDVLNIIEREIKGFPKGQIMLYSKTTNQKDYALNDTFQHISNMRGILEGTHYGWGTDWRRWEYGMCLSAIRENGAKTVLDVGGGSSMFPASAVWVGCDVTVVDPEDYTEWFEEHSKRIPNPINFVHDDFFSYSVKNKFDAVTAISVIEHVKRDKAFFSKLMRHVKPEGLLCLTTDFHPSGTALFGGHLRTYNAEMMNELRVTAEEAGFEVFGEQPNYEQFLPHVANQYCFASLVLKRK